MKFSDAIVVMIPIPMYLPFYLPNVLTNVLPFFKEGGGGKRSMIKQEEAGFGVWPEGVCIPILLL